MNKSMVMLTVRFIAFK